MQIKSRLFMIILDQPEGYLWSHPFFTEDGLARAPHNSSTPKNEATLGPETPEPWVPSGCDQVFLFRTHQKNLKTTGG